MKLDNLTKLSNIK